MKTKNFFFLSILIIAAGCSPSTNANTGTSFTNSDATFSGNVSAIYELSQLATIGSWTGADIKWRDSSGIISLSGFAGKPILLSFWATSPNSAASDEFSLDSTKSDLGDSVAIVTISESTFQATDSYVTANKIGVQVVVDSAGLAELQYAEINNSTTGQPQTYILNPNGSIVADLQGDATAHMLDSLARAAYK